MLVKKVKQLIVVLPFMFAGTMKATGQNQPVVTLQECLEYALENSHSMRAAQLQIAETAAKTKEVRAAALPQASATAAMNTNPAIPVVMLPGEIIGQPGVMIPAELGVKYDANAAVQLSQTVFNPALFTGIRAARNAEELMRLKSQLTEEQLIYDVASVYFDILHSEQQLKSVSGNIALQDSLFAKTTMRVEQDLAREIDLNRIRVNLSGLEVWRESLQNVIRQQKRYLQLLANMPPDEDFTLDEHVLVLTVSSLPTTDYPQPTKTEVAILESRKNLNALELKAVTMQYVPTVSLVASGAYQFMSQEFRLGNNDNWFKSAFVGVRLNVPIFDGAAKHHKIAQIKSQGLALDNERDLTERSLDMERKNAVSELHVSYRSVRQQEENLRLAERNSEQSRLLYNEGLYSVTDMLHTEQSLREAQATFNSEIIRYKKAELKLMKTEGKLFELVSRY